MGSKQYLFCQLLFKLTTRKLVLRAVSEAEPPMWARSFKLQHLIEKLNIKVVEKANS